MTRFDRIARVERVLRRDPLAVYAALHAHGTEAQLLHAGPGYAPGTSRTILALDPEQTLRISHTDDCDLFEMLQRSLDAYQLDAPATELPFVGGWVGYIAYDILDRTENISRRHKEPSGFADLEMSFHRKVLQYDPATGIWCATKLLTPGEDEDLVEDELFALLLQLDTPAPILPEPPYLSEPLTSNMSQTAYEAAVCKALDYITAGDIYQVNLSQAFTARIATDPLTLARQILARCPAPYAAALSFGPRMILSTSPERFLLLDGDHVTTCPVKGTRPRGRHHEEDEAQQDALWHSEKETAELAMITDLLRNDLGRVCAYGSVAVTAPRVMETHHNVHHTHSVIEGVLRAGLRLPELLKAVLPGGSVTGAPKIRAMEIIEALEPHRRGPYCGCIGYIGLDGRVDLNIAIRTVLLSHDTLRFHVGSGIVADSNPTHEYHETLHKARGIFASLHADDVH